MHRNLVSNLVQYLFYDCVFVYCSWNVAFEILLSAKENAQDASLVHSTHFVAILFCILSSRSLEEMHAQGCHYRVYWRRQHIETFYACQRWIVAFIKDYIGGIWSSTFFFCIYDILTTQALPRLSLLHDALDKKYLIGKKLQEFKKD